MGDKSRNGIERDLIDMIKANMYQEKVRIDQYIHDLKDDIKFLRNQALRKDEIIFKLLAQLGDKSVIETMPTQISRQNSSIKINEFIPEVNPPRNIYQMMLLTPK